MVMGFSFLDIAIVFIFIAFIIIGINRGLILTLYNFVSFILSIYITNQLYPTVAKMLRSTGSIYDNMKLSIMDMMNFQDVAQTVTKNAEAEFITKLNLPDFLKQPILENNNNVIYKLLDVSSFEEYVAGFLANIAVSAIAAMLVFVLSFVVIRVLSVVLRLVSMLPVIRTLNKTGGAIVGVIEAYFVVCIIMAVLIVILPYTEKTMLFQNIEQSMLASFFYSNNIILNMFLSIF